MIFEFFMQVLGFVAVVYVLYIIYSSKTNISDEDIDKVSKGGDKG
jgi:uncharacterized membrane protein